MRPTPATVVRVGAAIAMLAYGLAGVSVTPAVAAAPPSWLITPSPNPAGPTHGELDGIACTTTTSCLAVGETGAYGPLGELTLGERWNGGSWSQVTTPDPSWIFGVGPAYLSAIACATAGKCFAVGYEVNSSAEGAGPIIQRWNGSSWSYDSAPGFGSNATLRAVSCAGASSCHAVGDDGTAPFATRWNGSSWVAVPMGKPAGAIGVAVSGVKCTSATNCVAVGSYRSTPFVTKTLTERWNGKAWAIVSSPNPAGATSSSLKAVACPTASTCYAVGTSAVTRTHQQRVLVESWNGSAWSIASSPSPAGLAALDSVTCASTSWCMAVGTTGASTLVERWNGTKWVIAPSPSPAGARSSELQAVNCPSLTACFAVGSGAFASGHTNDRVFTERWNGSAWTVQASPVGTSVTSLRGVSCTSSTFCFAAGSYEAIGAPTTRPLLEQRNGTTWMLASAPVPVGATASELDDVACVSAKFCVAVGDATVGSQHALIEQWDGSTWKVASVAVAGSLSGVACGDVSHCAAVGTSAGKTLVEQWDGSSWTTAPGAVPGALSSVSCGDASDCMAVGVINLPNSPVLQWDGVTWTPIDGAAPSDSGDSGITPTSVSCAASDGCMLVGNYRDFSNHPFTYSAHWDGVAWSLVSMTVGGFGGFANDVACASGTDCTAVGDYFPGHGSQQTSVVHWDGTAWTIVTSPDVSAASPPGDGLTSVACTSASDCSAVGWWVSDASTRTLIERFA